MPDRFAPEVRSRIMASIKGKNTGLERRVLSALRKRGIYFQRHYRRARGSPDIALPRKRLAVFINGDFWHGYRYKRWSERLGSDFWRNKIEKNMSRDRRVIRFLRSRGWKVIRVWEHEVNKKFELTLARIVGFLRQEKK